MSGVADPHNLQRFVDAQADVYDDVRAELRSGHKTSHWMWFIFPQLAGLGQTQTAHRFGIRSIEEARAYLSHPVLGPRLVECAHLVCDIPGSPTVERVMGGIDALKLRSSMTLFREAADDPAPYQAVLDRFYGGEPDDLTLELLRTV